MNADASRGSNCRLLDELLVIEEVAPIPPSTCIALPEYAERTLQFANSDVLGAMRPVPAGGQVVRELRHTVGPDFEMIELRGPSRRRWIHGVASTPATDQHLTTMDPGGCLMSLPCPLLFGHGHGANGKPVSKDMAAMQIGEIVLLHRTAERLWVEAVISDTRAGDAAWALIKSGQVRAFSIAMRNGVPAGHVDGRTFIDRWELTEVSVCYSGSNPEARFTIGGDYDVDFV